MGSFADLVVSLGGPQRLATAGGLVATYASLCVYAMAAHRQRRLARDGSRPSGGATGTGLPILVAFASQTGYAEEIATQTAEYLRASGLAVRVVSFEHLTRDAVQAATQALFIVSTTGEGDAPDSAARFRREMTVAGRPLTELRYGVLALGDRLYEQYCAFGLALDAWLRQQGAEPMFDVIDVDAGDRMALDRWKGHVGALGGDPHTGAWAAPLFTRWRVCERRLLNAGSPGGPAFHVALEATEPTLPWRPGDIAQVVAGTSEPVPAGVTPLTREYSIASIPDDRRIELLIRQVRREDGTLGVGSGWLTAQVPLGADVWLRIRANQAFHPPDPERPLVLIGNGTGLAGLRAHLKARARIGRHRNWLLFGERTEAHDAFHRDEIQAWLDAGVLARCDLAFSRDGDQLYVQDLLVREGETVRRWAADGAAFYVCGSRTGMATGVDAALASVLGASAVEALSEGGRYRRDVY